MDNIYINIKDYNPNKESKMLIVFDDVIADMLSNKKCQLILTELFIRGKNLKIYHTFIKQFFVLHRWSKY